MGDLAQDGSASAGVVDTERPAGRWDRLRRSQWTAWHTERELASAVLGILVVSSVMVGASIHGTLLDVEVDALVTLAVYWTAERYADVLAASARAEPLTRRRIIAQLGHGSPMLEGAVVPAAVLLVVALSTGRLQAGTLTALAVATALLGYVGSLAAHRAGRHGRAASLAWAGMAALLGGVVIVLKFSLH
jgi:hypothetical protein